MDWLKLAQAKRQQIIEQTSKLVSVNSIEQPETAAPGAPYGAEVRRVLDYALEMGRSAGFATRDFEGKVGRIECGAGDRIFGILAHLDIVPAGEGWLTDPFTAVIKDGRLHGRGVIDDKGPAAAILAAMEIASSLVPQPKCKVHLILGCNEETGMGCMRHYVEHIPDQPDFGVTPDNSFPVVFGEKGIIRAQVTGPVTSAIVSFDAGLRPNVVPNLAKAAVKMGGLSEAEIRASFDAYLAAHHMTGELSCGNGLVSAQLNGVSCHAQAPPGRRQRRHPSLRLDRPMLPRQGRLRQLGDRLPLRVPLSLRGPGEPLHPPAGGDLSGYPWMPLFFGDQAENYRTAHLAGALTAIPYMAAVDEYQHRVFEKPDMTARERRAVWREIKRAYMPWRDYDGNAFLEEGGFWMQKLHIFMDPFYYIEYALAQTCAFQFYDGMKRDRAKAWADYCRLCRAGGSLGYFQLLQLAGLRNPFQPGCVEQAVAGVREELGV